MLILDVGKIRYNKKFYKTIIYTTLVLNILSYGIFPKSQSKYKEEVDNEVVYTAKLYTEERKTEEITTNKTVTITDIKLVENDYHYVSDGGNAFFEYSIPDVDSKLDFANINSNITFDYTTTNASTKGSCSVVKQVAKNEKGVIWCKGSETNSFERYGITLSINAKDTYVNRSPYLIETVNVTIKGEKSYTRSQYKTDSDRISNAVSDSKRVILSNPGDCTTFDKWLEDYDAYYAANALYYYNLDTGLNSTESFSEIEAIKKYVAMYGVNSSSCNLESLAIPGISREVVTDSTNNLKRYIYTIEDNFVGYAKTYTQSSDSKEMYFTTSDGRSFIDETDNTKWQSIFSEYLNKYYQNENPKEVADYVDILSVLQQVDDTNLLNGVLHSFKEGKVTLEPALLDYVYNNKYKAEGKVRVTILDNGSTDTTEIIELKQKMYDTFKDNLDVVYGDVYYANTIISLWTSGTNKNAEQRDLIRNAIMKYYLTSEGEYIDGLREYKPGFQNDALRFSVHVYGDGTYNWFEILPLGEVYDTNIKYYLNDNLSSTQNKQEEYLRRIDRLNKYYGINKQPSINESITYIRDENGNVTGYVQIEHLNGNIDNIRYTAYKGGDLSNYPPETASSNNIVVQDKETSTIVDKEMNDSIEEKEEEIPTVEVKDEETVTIESASADSNLSGGDKEGNKEQLNVVQEDGGLTDKTDTDDKNSDIPLDDSDATSINPATNSSGSSVQQAGAETVPSPSTNNSIESINEIQIEIPPISTQ